MADGLKEALSQYVPAAVLDEAVEAIKATEVSPEWYRNDIAKVGARAKQADEFESRLNSIESAPKRKEALKRVGIDYDAVPKYGQEALDSLPVEDLEDLEKVAKFVNDKGFEAKVAQQDTSGGSGAEQITNFLTNQGASQPGTESYEQAIANAQTPEQLNEVYARFGKEVPT